MKKIRILVVGLIIVLLVVSFPAAAAVVDPGSAADDNRPTEIIEHGRGLNTGLVRVTHIHYAKVVDKGKPSGPSRTETCYRLGGWKWDYADQYMIQGTDSQYDALFSPVTKASDTWDAATAKTLFNTAGKTSGKTWGGTTPDYVNLVTFGNYQQDGVIAVTSTWYSTLTNTVIDSDIMFDTDFVWGDATKVSDVMDTQNIATHEIGHSLGLSDLYKKPCNAVTMYGYSWNGDTGKRTLEVSDAAGIQAIYGA